MIKTFKKSELRPIKESSLYHSPDVSETDEDNSEQRKIVTKDLEWRSLTVRLLIIDEFNCFNIN